MTAAVNTIEDYTAAAPALRSGWNHLPHGGAMRFKIGAPALALALPWGALVALVGLVRLVWPAYGGALWELAVSIYPGVGVGGIGTVLLATLYATIDGGVCGGIIAGIYNAAAGQAPAA